MRRACVRARRSAGVKRARREGPDRESAPGFFVYGVNEEKAAALVGTLWTCITAHCSNEWPCGSRKASRRTRYRRIARSARARTGIEETASEAIRELLRKARRAARSPGFLFFAPLAESAYARVSETRRSGFESRVGHQYCRIVLLQLGMWQDRAGMARGSSAASPAPRRGFESRCLLQRFRRLRVRTAAFQAADAGSSPAGNTMGM